MAGPAPNQCSTSNVRSPKASPKAISGRTSYFRVRLEFHRYPHLIPALFNVRGFGPPVSVTSPSPWTGVDHTVSGLRPHTLSPFSDSLSLRLRLPTLTSHANVTRRFILQKARRHPSIGLRLLVSTRFQVLFHSAPAVLFTFPSRYCFTIGRQGVFSLTRWSWQIHTGFLVSRATRDPFRRRCFFGYRTLTPYGWPFHANSPKTSFSYSM